MTVEIMQRLFSFVLGQPPQSTTLSVFEFLQRYIHLILRISGTAEIRRVLMGAFSHRRYMSPPYYHYSYEYALTSTQELKLN